MKPTSVCISICSLLVLSAFAGCVETVDWELQAGDNGKLVVEAIITDERKRQEIRLSRSYDDLNGPTPAVDDAIVTVSVAGTTYSFPCDHNDPGKYVSEVPFAVVDQLDYVLEIDWEGGLYTAVSRLSDVAPIPVLSFRTKPGYSDSLYIGTFAPVYNANQQAMYEVDIDWSHFSQEEAQAKVFYYTFSRLDVSEFVRPVRDTVFFPRGSVLHITKYGLNEEFADYLRAMVIETDWKGGIFYSASASTPSNISNGGLGFFSTCAVVKKTLVAR